MLQPLRCPLPSFRLPSLTNPVFSVNKTRAQRISFGEIVVGKATSKMVQVAETISVNILNKTAVEFGNFVLPRQQIDVYNRLSIDELSG